jgi:hypothetical protein
MKYSSILKILSFGQKNLSCVQYKTHVLISEWSIFFIQTNNTTVLLGAVSVSMYHWTQKKGSM